MGGGKLSFFRPRRRFVPLQFVSSSPLPSSTMAFQVSGEDFEDEFVFANRKYVTVLSNHNFKF